MPDVEMMTVDVIVSCRCHKKIEVPKGSTKSQINKIIINRIDNIEVDPDGDWVPESFCNKLNIYFEKE